MNDILIVSLDKSQEDVPVITVMRDNPFPGLTGPSMKVISVITGKEALELWCTLCDKKKKENTND